MTDLIRDLAREPDILLGRLIRTPYEDRREKYHLIHGAAEIEMDITDIVHGRDVDEYRL